MQIYALNRHSQLVHASQANRKQTYKCPECQGQVRPRGGHIRQLHFYHTKSAVCTHLGKSATHLQIQYALQKMLGTENALLECRFPEIGRVADVVWPQKKLIFEVQVSPITAEEIASRNQDYRKIGYTVVWILHDRRYNHSHMTQAEISLRSSPHYFTNINALGKGIFYDQHATTRFKRRLTRSRRFPVRFTQVSPLNLKQLPRQFPTERKKWAISFEGDLYHHRHNLPLKREIPLFFRIPIRLYRILFRLLLEKTTS